MVITRFFWPVLIVSIGFLVSCGPKKLPPNEPPIETPAESVPEEGIQKPVDEVKPSEEAQPSRNVIVTPPQRPRIPPKGETASMKLIQKGISSLNAGNLSEAEVQFEQALRVSPNNGRSYYYLGVIAARQKNWERSLSFLERAETLLDEDAFWSSQIYLQQGLVLKAMNRKEEARQKFQQALKRDPDNEYAQKELNTLN